MDWILEHLRLIIAGAGAIAWWLNQRKQARAAGQTAPRKDATSADPDLAERTRRIREEIQRKIEERAKAYKASGKVTPQRGEPPVIREVAKSRTDSSAILKPQATRADTQRTAEVLEQQAALVEKLRQAKELKAAAARRVQFENRISDEEPAKPAVAMALKGDLRDPAALRRAFVLREIIGPPVALR